MSPLKRLERTQFRRVRTRRNFRWAQPRIPGADELLEAKLDATLGLKPGGK
jgi:hypothetical protein